MAGLDDRRDAAEARFAREEEARYRAAGRRDRYLGEWAAGRMGLAGDAASSYAASIAESRHPGPGDDGLVARVVSDIRAAGASADEAEVRALLPGLAARARSELGLTA